MNSDTSPSSVGAPVRVLQVMGNAIVGGMEKWVERLIERMPRSRFLMSALCPFESPFTERLRALDVEVLITPMPDDPPWSSVQMTASIVSALRIDLLHAHLPNAHLLAGLAGKLANKPVLTTIHGRQLTTLDLEVHRAVGSHLSVVCKQSYYHALSLGVEPAHLSCDTNGVDTQVFQPASGQGVGAGLRAALGLPADAPLVGFIGRLSHEKGPEVFVRAAMLLRRSQPHAHFVMIGEGPLKGQMTQLAEQFGVADRLHLLGMRTDMPRIYQELDIAVSSSHSEAMPLAVMEAMASGLPVIATRVGGVPDLIEHGRTGWLVSRGDFEDIAGHCSNLINDPAARRGMGELARLRAVERLELNASVARMEQLFLKLARPRGELPRRGAVVSTLPGDGLRRAAGRTQTASAS